MSDTDKAMRIDPKLLDPKFKYTWVLDETKTMVGFRTDGYSIVKGTDPDVSKLKELNDPRISSLDGNIRVGDSVLMRRPKEEADAEDKERREKQKNSVRAIRENFHAQAASLGVPSFDEDKP